MAAIQLGHQAFFRETSPGISAVAAHGRVLFLDAVQYFVPDVLRSLASDVFPVYQKLWANQSKTRYLLGLRNGWGSVRVARDGFRWELLEIQAALLQWGRAWYLDEPWVYDTAISTMDAWLGSSGHRRWQHPPSSLPTPWTLEEEIAYERARAQHESVAEFEDIASKQGFHRAPRKWSPHHFKWLALRQCFGRRYSDLASDPLVSSPELSDPPTISEAVERTANLIGLKPRPTRRGRPRKDQSPNR